MLPVAELEAVAVREWARAAPHAIDPPPWQAMAGEAGCNALVSRSPGTEGSDRHFAELLSRLAPGRTVHSLWLDPERRQAFAWREGRELPSIPATVEEVAAQAGFAIAPAPVPPEAEKTAAAVEGASLWDVRAVLGEFAHAPWLRVEQGSTGVVITATDGPLGTQPWDVAEALPSATACLVQRRVDGFEVLVLRGTRQVGQFRVPPLAGVEGALAAIKGETAPGAILRALGIVV